MLQAYLWSLVWFNVTFLALTTTNGSVSGFTSRSLKMHTTGLLYTCSVKSYSSKIVNQKDIINLLQPKKSANNKQQLAYACLAY
jgi:hypothetical protein